VPVALLLLLLTAIGPLLAWRKTSLESLKRNFLYPAIGALSIGGMMILFGVRPWEDPSYFYATMAAVLSALVMFTVISEFSPRRPRHRRQDAAKSILRDASTVPP